MAERRTIQSGPTILVVDDEPNIVELARLYLASEGYRVESASDGREALEKVATLKPALVVLDVMMPVIDGWEVCRRLRRDGGRTPIIMLTAKGDDVDRIVGLEIGADDYMAKPFNPRELVARVRAVLRRSQEPDKATRVLTGGNVRVDIGRREVTIGERAVEMRAKEFDLLVAFMENLGLVLDRETLLRVVWGYDYLGDSRTIDVHVTWLRDKLSGATARIQTIRGIGYKLIIDERGDAPRT
ncbi:MAG: response regulator transcription factor [Chloroflexota bacterium]|nr:MAG: response regulator transcription factor [Chloroflexota bacterium]